jgi:hypothetical protein
VPRNTKLNKVVRARVWKNTRLLIAPNEYGDFLLSDQYGFGSHALGFSVFSQSILLFSFTTHKSALSMIIIIPPFPGSYTGHHVQNVMASESNMVSLFHGAKAPGRLCFQP